MPTRLSPLHTFVKLFTEDPLAPLRFQHINVHGKNHFIAVTEELLNHILALLPILWPQNSKNKLHFGRRERLTTRCHELLHKAESLPEYATEKLLAHQYKAASGGLLLP